MMHDGIHISNFLKVSDTAVMSNAVICFSRLEDILALVTCKCLELYSAIRFEGGVDC